MRQAVPRLYLRAAADGLRQALASGAESVVVELPEREPDGPAPGRRDGPLLFVEVGPPDAAGSDAALDRALRLGPDGVVLRGCRGLPALEHLSARLAVREAEAGLAEGTIGVLATVDDPAGIVALPSLAGGAPRLVGLCCDLGRLRVALGCEAGAPALQLAAATLVTVAAAAARPAIAACGEAGLSHAPARAAPRPGGASRLLGPHHQGQGDRALLVHLAAQGFRGAILSSAEEVALARTVFGPLSPAASA